MTTSQDHVVTGSPIGGLGAETLIVVIAVACAALLVTQPAALAIALSIGLLLASLSNFDWFVYAVVFLLPWYPILDPKLPVRDVFVASRFALLAGVWMIQGKRGRSLRDWVTNTWVNKGVLIFAGVATASLLVSAQRTNLDAYKVLIRTFSYIAVFFAMSGWLVSRDNLVKIIQILLISTIGVALFGFYQALDGSYTEFYFRLYPLQEDVLEPWTGRITSFLYHFNSLAGYLNLVVPFSIGCLVLAKDHWMRWLGLICFATCTAALVLTQSRGGLIAYAASLIVSIWYLAPKPTVRIGILAAIAVILALTAPMLMNYFERLQSVDELTELSRLAIWALAGSMFLSHPVLGVGYGTYRISSLTYVPEPIGGQLHAHNLYLQLLAETGAVGFLVFFALIGAFFYIGVKLVKDPDSLYRIVGIGTCGALTATLVHGMVDFLFNVSPQFGALFWLVLALSIAAFQNSRKPGKVDNGLVT
jgi:putative inorganic carbon (HCO3(-)) transporter